MIKNLASNGPKPGDRIQPSFEEQYFIITRVHRNRVYYDWTPQAENRVFLKKEERSIPVRDLAWDHESKKWRQISGQRPATKLPPLDPLWVGVIDYFGVKTLETRAKTREDALRNFAHQLAKQHNHHIQAVRKYFDEYPHRVKVEQK